MELPPPASIPDEPAPSHTGEFAPPHAGEPAPPRAGESALPPPASSPAKPAPSHAPESVARGPVRGISDAAFTTFVAVVITIVSVLIAVGAWRTTDAANRASDLDSLVIQQLARRQQEMEDLNGQVDLDLRLFARYQAYTLAAAALDTAATAAGEPGAIDRQLLEVEAQGQRALARVLHQFFRGALPAVDAEGLADYDPERVLRNLVAGSTRLADLRPEVTQGRADLVHRQTAAFVLLVILLTACLVLLTLAQVVHGRPRVPLAVAGTLVAFGGLVLLVLVETTLFAGG